MTFILMISFLVSAVNPTGLASPENASDSKPLVPGVGGRVIAVVKKIQI